MDVLETGPSEPRDRHGIRTAVIVVVAVALVAGAIIVGAARWWSVQSDRPDRLEIYALEAIGPFAIAGEDLPEGWPDGLVAPALRLRVQVSGDPQRAATVRPVGETASYATDGSTESAIPAGERVPVDLVVTPADCRTDTAVETTSPLIDGSSAAVPMSAEATQALSNALDSVCAAGGDAPLISTTAARIDVFFRDRTLIMRLRVTTAADRVVLQPRDSIGFRGGDAAEATIEDRTASARLRWLVSPAEAMNLEEPTVRVRTFGITGGRAYPWVLDLRVPSVREFIDPGGERP